MEAIQEIMKKKREKERKDREEIANINYTEEYLSHLKYKIAEENTKRLIENSKIKSKLQDKILSSENEKELQFWKNQNCKIKIRFEYLGLCYKIVIYKEIIKEVKFLGLMIKYPVKKHLYTYEDIPFLVGLKGNPDILFFMDEKEVIKIYSPRTFKFQEEWYKL